MPKKFEENEIKNEQVDSKEGQLAANVCIGTGVGIGAWGTTLAVTTAHVCPFCVVAAPAFIGCGIYKKKKSQKGGEDIKEEKQ